MSKRYSRCFAIVLAVAVFLSFTIATTAEVNAASSGTKKATVFNVIKKGNTAYCATYGGIYKVKLKNGKVVSKKCMYKTFAPKDMKLKGKYLYFKNPDAWADELYRVNIKTGKVQDVIGQKGRFKKYPAVDVKAYAFKGNKLYTKVSYCDPFGADVEYKNTFVSKLNGKSEKVTKVKVKNKIKASNKSGYKVINDDSKYPMKSYLKTPKGKYFICESTGA